MSGASTGLCRGGRGVPPGMGGDPCTVVSTAADELHDENVLQSLACWLL